MYAHDLLPQPLWPLAQRAGIGLRAPHVVELLDTRPQPGFIEVHSENYFGRGGKPLHLLQRVRRDQALSLHGVGLSLGSADPLSTAHLQRLAELIDQLEPALVSEHLCWSSVGGVHANDLLPLPYTEEALDHVVTRVQQVQQRLGRRLLIENPSSYVAFAHSTLDEAGFLAELARRSGCAILLDLNNLYVSARNQGFDAQAYLRALPPEAVHEMHLAGHVRQAFDAGDILIDTHSRPVADAVWSLYRDALARFGAVPTLVEWDAELPPLAVLLAEAQRADAVLAEHLAEPRHACAA